MRCSRSQAMKRETRDWSVAVLTKLHFSTIMAVLQEAFQPQLRGWNTGSHIVCRRGTVDRSGHDWKMCQFDHQATQIPESSACSASSHIKPPLMFVGLSYRLPSSQNEGCHQVSVRSPCFQTSLLSFVLGMPQQISPFLQSHRKSCDQNGSSQAARFPPEAPDALRGR